MKTTSRRYEYGPGKEFENRSIAWKSIQSRKKDIADFYGDKLEGTVTSDTGAALQITVQLKDE